MALIEKINQMKQSGMSEAQIIKTLRDENYTPVQINEALSQSQIKAAIAQPASPVGGGMDGMEQSIMQTTDELNQMPVPYPEQAQQAGYPAEAYPAYQQVYAQPPAQYPAEQAAYTEQPYYDQNYGQAYVPQETYYQQALDIETVRDIAKQSIEEELLKIKSQISEITKLKTDLKFQIQNIDNRLKKIEEVIQEIQSAVLQKVGNFGQAINEISEELHATQESFGKLVNPIIDKKRGMAENQKSEQQANQAKIKPRAGAQSRSSPRTQKPAPSFEDYFR